MGSGRDERPEEHRAARSPGHAAAGALGTSSWRAEVRPLVLVPFSSATPEPDCRTHRPHGTRRPSNCGSRLPRASISRPACSPPISTSRPKNWTWCCTWATTSENGGREKQVQASRPGDRFARRLRNRYAQYKADSQLQAAHFSRPWLVVWTTMKGQLCRRHLEKPEVSNAELLLRRQCLPGLHEHMPLR